MKNDLTLHVLAAHVHGELAAGHRLGIKYAQLTGNKVAVAFHSIALRFSEKAVQAHLADIAKLENK